MVLFKNKYYDPVSESYAKNKRLQIMEYNMLLNNINPLNKKSVDSLKNLKEKIFSDLDTRKGVVKNNRLYIVPVKGPTTSTIVKSKNGKDIMIHFKSTYLNKGV